MHLLGNANVVQDLRDTVVCHIRDQSLAIIEQLEDSIRRVEVLARVDGELCWVALRKVDQCHDCFTRHC